MRLIKCIFCKIDHLIVNMVCRLFINPIGDTALYSLCLISINEVLTLFFHDSRLFLTHCTAHQIASAHGIASQVTDDLHNLLLVNDTAIGRA